MKRLTDARLQRLMNLLVNNPTVSTEGLQTIQADLMAIDTELTAIRAAQAAEKPHPKGAR